MSVYKVDRIDGEWVMTQVKQLATDYTSRIAQYLQDSNHVAASRRDTNTDVRVGHELLRTGRPSAENIERPERGVVLQQTD